MSGVRDSRIPADAGHRDGSFGNQAVRALSLLADDYLDRGDVSHLAGLRALDLLCVDADVDADGCIRNMSPSNSCRVI